MKLDGTAKRILNLLRRDARMTYKQIGDAIGKPESTVRDRIRRLEQTGVIRGYTAILDKGALGLGCLALVLADVDYDRLEEVTGKLLDVPNVLQVHHTSGDRRLAFVLVTKNLDDLQTTLENYVSKLGFKDEEVIILLKTFREFGTVLEF